MRSLHPSRMFNFLFTALFFCSSEVGAQQKGPDKLQLIAQQSADKYVKAFKDRNAKSLAALFTSEGEYIDSTGTIFHGRGAIEAEFAESLKGVGDGTLVVEIISIRPIAAGVMVEDGISTFKPDKEGAATRTRYSATHVLQPDGQWLMASIRESAAEDRDTHGKLRALEWLKGRWSEEVSGSFVKAEWAWSQDGNYLISEFHVRQSSDVSWNGNHRVGWDAERQQFRSWIFDSSGGFAEGTWRWDDEKTWSLSLESVDADGVRSSSTLSYRRDGADSIVLTQSKRVRAGVSLPDNIHRIVRQPPAPASAKK